MQLKLLNFHKMLANFSTSLIGGFIPLIIYKQTNNIVLSVSYLVIMYFLNFIINLIFRKQIVKRPQLFLLLRAIPILGYSLSVILIETNFVLGLILVTIFYAASLSFKGNPNELILNYSYAQNSGGSKSLGLTRFFEQFGSIIALIAGGLFLDYLDTYILIIIVMSIYILSTIPLLMFYVRFRKQKGFNKEVVSNAFMHFSQREDRSKQGQIVAKKILTYYGITYFLLGLIDAYCSLFNLFIYVKMGQFASAGYFNAVFNASFGIGAYIVGFISAKHDTTILASVSFILNGVLCAITPFVTNTIALYVIFTTIGITYPTYSLFLIERMLAKTRILGVSNKAIAVREDVSALAKSFCPIFAMFGSLIPPLMVMGAGLIFNGCYLAKGEEKTRQILVHYLEDDLEQ